MKGTAALLASLVLAIAPIAAEPRIDFDGLYTASALGLSFSPLVQDNRDKTVSIEGFMAPPLRAEGDFFVLTKFPVTLCPYCNSDADWPKDIIVVYLKKEEVFVQRGRSILVTGRLELGSYTDPETGFVSLLRLVDSRYKER